VSFPILGSAIAGAAPSFPSVRGSVAVSSQNSGTSFVPTIPTHSAGNIILVFVSYKGAGSGVAHGFPAAAVTASAGWTEKAQAQNTNDTNQANGGIALFSRTATTSSHSITITNSNDSNIIAHVYVIQGGSSVEASVTTAKDPPSLSPSWGTDFTYWIAAEEEGDGGTTGVVPTGFSNTVQTSSGNAALTTCDRNEVTATQDPSAFSGGGLDDSCVMTVGVRP
jgi:hypothetical protein